MAMPPTSSSPRLLGLHQRRDPTGSGSPVAPHLGERSAGRCCTARGRPLWFCSCGRCRLAVQSCRTSWVTLPLFYQAHDLLTCHRRILADYYQGHSTP